MTDCSAGAAGPSSISHGLMDALAHAQHQHHPAANLFPGAAAAQAMGAELGGPPPEAWGHEFVAAPLSTTGAPPTAALMHHADPAAGAAMAAEFHRAAAATGHVQPVDWLRDFAAVHNHHHQQNAPQAGHQSASGPARPMMTSGPMGPMGPMGMMPMMGSVPPMMMMGGPPMLPGMMMPGAPVPFQQHNAGGFHQQHHQFSAQPAGAAAADAQQQVPAPQAAAAPEVETFSLAGEPQRTVEQKTEASAFHKFMGEIKSGAVEIVDGDRQTGPAPEALAAEQKEQEAAAAEMQRMLDAGADGVAAEGPLDEGLDEGALAGEFLNEHAAAAAADGGLAGDFLAEASAGANAAAAAAATAGGDAMATEFIEGEEAEGWANDFTGMNGAGADDWLREYQELIKNTASSADQLEYPFEAQNTYLHHDRPFEEGLELVEAGALAEAVLAFEAACQKCGGNVPLPPVGAPPEELAAVATPEAMAAWRALGTTQALNEKDGLAIRALNRARRLAPGDLEVLSSLAVSHTNEANAGLALRALREWVEANPKFSSLHAVAHEAGQQDAAGPSGAIDADVVPGGGIFSGGADIGYVSATTQREVRTLFEAASTLDPSDAEVHQALGVIHSVGHSYDDAAAAFEVAAKLRPRDERLWNRVGATLANGNRSREALDAYGRALEINPGFVRARYNLGIAHSNLSEHRLAARHFLQAIVMQQGGAHAGPSTAPAVAPEGFSGPGTGLGHGNGGGGPRSTRELWDVLRMTFNLMERPDLVEAAWKQDVSVFLDEFDLGDLNF